MTAFAKRRDLNVADFPHVAVFAQEDAAVAEDAGAGAMVHAHQDGVLAALGGPYQVFRQGMGPGVVAQIDG